MARTVLALLLLSSVPLLFASHFRGSMMTWRVVNSTSNPLRVEILQRHAWNYTWWPCTNAHITAGNYMIGSGSVKCYASCPANVSTLGSVAVPCTGYNQIEQYVSGEGRFTFSVPQDVRFRAVFNDSAWFSLVTGGSGWVVSTEINTFKRANGRYNQAPIVTMLPIIRLRRNLTHYVKINVADNDFDRYICLWSNTTQECGGICRSSLSLPATTYLNETSCVLRFTPVNVGFYAMAFTVLDFENETNTAPLSRVPVQFIFNVWNSNATCTLLPLYIGDAAADECIFVEPGLVVTVVIRIQIQCPNATLANVIGVFPSGFSQSPTFTDPYNPMLYNFRVSYAATADQVGQNLFCFAGVDSIGNQGEATCLRFTVQLGSDSRNTLYVNNATRSPMGLVSKYHSNWTLLYPTGVTFTRPNTDAFVRFKLASTKVDFVSYSVLTQPQNVVYRSDRLEIISDVVFSAGTQFYVSLDPGVFLPIATCLRDSMGITDSTFWPFYTAFEASTTSTTTTTVSTTTVTARNRTVPTVRTIPSTLSSTTTTTPVIIEQSTSTPTLTTPKPVAPDSSFPVSTAVGVALGSLVAIGLAIVLIVCLVRRYRKKSLSKISDEASTVGSDTHLVQQQQQQQYRLTTRTATQPSSRLADTNVRDVVQLTTKTHENLINITR